MHFFNFLGAVSALAMGVTAVPTPSDYNQAVSGVPAYQAASELKNVSTYHPLTRVQRSGSQLFGRGVGWRSFYGFSPTTSFGNGQAYYTPVKFGIQTFNLLIDTGSSDTWVIGEGVQCQDPTTGDLTSGSVCGFGPEWNAAGCTAIPNVNFNIPYGGGIPTDAGTFCTIDVTLAGITANKQQVAVATTALAFGTAPTSGVLGLAYPALTYAFHGTNLSADDRAVNQAPYNPLFTTMIEQKKLFLPLFSMALNRPSTEYENDGYIALGGLPPVLTVGEYARTPIQKVTTNQPGGYEPSTLPDPQFEYYTFMPDSFLYQINDDIWPNPLAWTPLPQPSGNLSFENQYIIDSGYTALSLAPIAADFLATKFDPPAINNPDLGAYSVPCNAKAPWFAIKIGGVIFPIDKRDMIISDQTGAGTCVAATTNGETYAPYTIGDTFLSNVVAVFDVGSGYLNFASRGLY